MEDEFDILAAKALAGEATREERSRLDSLLEASAERRKEYTALQATWSFVHDAGPAAFASEPVPVKIPDARLRHLQQVVREARPKSPATSPEPIPVPPRPAAETNLSLWHPLGSWLGSWHGLARGAAAAALVLGVIGATVWINRSPRHEASAGNPAKGAVAHLIVMQGTAEIRRGERRFVPRPAVTLRNDDELTLAPESTATLVTSNGEVLLRGPVRAPVGELAASHRTAPAEPADAGASPAASPGMAMLFNPADGLDKSTWIATTRSIQAIPIYSPAGATASLMPVILWNAHPGKTYDVTIQDEFESKTPAWRITNCVPPVVFTSVDGWQKRALTDQGLYRLRVRETGRPLTFGEITFRTSREDSDDSSNAPASPLLTAYRILSGKSARTGDALALLLTLPPDLAHSELALRLKLIAFSQLGLEAEWEDAAAALRKIP